MESFARLETRIWQTVTEYAFAQALDATRIMIVQGDKRASVRGAAALAHEQAGRADTKKPRRRR